MFIRALRAIVLPLVFVNVIISVVDMISLGRASAVGWKTIALYTLTTGVASIIGIISIVMFKNKFKEETLNTDSSPIYVRLGCNVDGQFVTELGDGTLACLAQDSNTTASTDFIIDDITGAFQRDNSGELAEISLSDTIYDGVFTKLITNNIVFSFVESNFAAVIIFAIFAGGALGSVVFKRGIAVSECHLVQVLTE